MTHLRIRIGAALVCALLALHPAWSQFGFQDMDVTNLRNPAPGYYFIAPNSVDSFSVMDNAGKNLYRTRIGQHANVLTFADKWMSHFSADRGQPIFLVRNLQRGVIDTMNATAPYQTDFHEGRILSDTSYVVLGLEVIKMDLSTVVSGGKTDADVWVNIIQERTFDGRTLFTWRSLDHIPITDAVDDIDLTSALVDYIHINAITVDRDGHFIVSCRHLDEVLKINRTTGAVIWRLGGSRSKNNQFTFINDTEDGFTGFSHQHAAVITSAGTLLLFDNGNLKPEPRRSRAVEYELNTTNMTAKRVWQHIPAPDLFAPTMGSVEELENGNILIGYGSGSNQIAAQEVNKDGVIEVQINNPATNGFSSYRVHKSTFLMTGVYRNITAAGNQSFTKGDSSTHLSINFTRVDSATSVVVERHSYGPHTPSFSGEAACGILPTRWVVRAKNPTKIAGTLSIDLGTTPGVEYPDKIALFYRSSEGSGTFSKVDATYSSSTKRLTANAVKNGEYAIAYSACLAPTLLQPLNGATEVPTEAYLSWSEAVGVGEYQLEVATDRSFTNIVWRLSTRRLDTTLPAGQLFTTYYWRARSKRVSGFGPWSAASMYTTQLGVPTIVYPRVVADTIATLQAEKFRWSSATGAARYRVEVIRVGSGQSVLDTILTGLEFVPLKPLDHNVSYTWTVQAVNDTIVGRRSKSEYFVTGLAAPSLESPIADASDVPFEDAEFIWKPVPTATRYVVTVRRSADSVIVKKDSTFLSSLVVSELPGGTRLTWSVIAVGKYGRGEESPRSPFTTVSSVRLPAPITIAPKRVSGVDTNNVEFSWTEVPDAKFYDVQITTRPNFTKPDIEVFGIEDTKLVADLLKPGKTYGWRVVGYAPGIAGRWSDTASFTTKPRDGQALIPLLPEAGAENVPTSGVFLYSTGSAYQRYRVLVDVDPEFLDPDFTFVSALGTCSYQGLASQQWYYWKVVGELWGGGLDEGSVVRFRTGGTTSVHDNVLGIPTTIWVSQGVVYLDDAVALNTRRAQLFDAMGRSIVEHGMDGRTTSFRIPGSAAGIFFVMLEDWKGAIQVYPVLVR